MATIDHRKVFGAGYHAGVASAEAASANDPALPRLSMLNAMLCWTPGTDKVALIEWPDTVGLSNEYECSDFACESEYHQMTLPQRQAQAMGMMMILLYVDGCNERAVLRAFSQLREWVEFFPSEHREEVLRAFSRHRGVDG